MVLLFCRSNYQYQAARVLLKGSCSFFLTNNKKRNGADMNKNTGGIDVDEKSESLIVNASGNATVNVNLHVDGVDRETVKRLAEILASLSGGVRVI